MILCSLISHAPTSPSVIRWSWTSANQRQHHTNHRHLPHRQHCSHHSRESCSRAALSYTMGSTRLTSDLLKHPRSAGLGGPCVSLMIGCPGGGNEIRLKTTPDATTDCMPPTSLRLRLLLILIHQHHPHQSKSQVRSNTPSPEKLRQIYKVTNQEITTDISHSRMFCSKSDYIAQQIKSMFFVCVLCV